MIFLDNASTTKPDEQIIQNFVDYQKYYFNPGANYSPSVFISSLIEKARAEIVSLLGGNELGTFVFTPSSTISNNIILNSVISNNKNEEYVFSSLEHPSVLNFANKLLLDGKKVIFVPSTIDGFIDEKELLNAINPNTKFVSIINVSNETGAVNNVNYLAKKIKEINPKTLVHSDGVQALGKIKICLDNLDFYTISSHKIYGIKGIAGFYAKNIKTLKPFVIGGGQEFNIISGTTNAPMIFCLRDAVKNAVINLKQKFQKVCNLNLVLKEKLKSIPNLVINSPKLNIESNEYNQNSCACSPYILSVSVLGVNAETIQNMLSEKEIYIGLGSACSAKKSGNKVLESMHKSKAEILGNLRISLSKNTTQPEIETFAKELILCTNELREKLKWKRLF